MRIGGPEPSSGPADIELIEALYADPLVQHALSRYGIAPMPAGGSIWQRFPVPHMVSPELAEDLYAACGLACGISNCSQASRRRRFCACCAAGVLRAGQPAAGPRSCVAGGRAPGDRCARPADRLRQLRRAAAEYLAIEECSGVTPDA